MFRPFSCEIGLHAQRIETRETVTMIAMLTAAKSKNSLHNSHSNDSRENVYPKPNHAPALQ